MPIHPCSISCTGSSFLSNPIIVPPFSQCTSISPFRSLSCYPFLMHINLLVLLMSPISMSTAYYPLPKYDLFFLPIGPRSFPWFALVFVHDPVPSFKVILVAPRAVVPIHPYPISCTGSTSLFYPFLLFLLSPYQCPFPFCPCTCICPYPRPHSCLHLWLHVFRGIIITVVPRLLLVCTCVRRRWTYLWEYVRVCGCLRTSDYTCICHVSLYTYSNDLW